MAFLKIEQTSKTSLKIYPWPNLDQTDEQSIPRELFKIIKKSTGVFDTN
jgi:hypothetical protein